MAVKAFSSAEVLLLIRKYLNAAKPPEQSKGLSGNIGCKDKRSTWLLLLFVVYLTLTDPL